eukprot:2812112-Amphidinium_carterae.1
MILWQCAPDDTFIASGRDEGEPTIAISCQQPGIGNTMFGSLGVSTKSTITYVRFGLNNS